ncbi:MAG: hypothetical protein ABIN36_17495 [Ferruginibacter sp.]
MNHDYMPTEFSKSLLAGLFAGIGAACTNLIYNFLFRAYSGLPFSQIINISTIIFASLILMTVSGLLFNVFHHYIKKGTFVFRIFFTLLTIIAIAFSLSVKRSDDNILNNQFRELLIGILIIFGIFGTFIIPLLFKSNKI